MRSVAGNHNMTLAYLRCSNKALSQKCFLLVLHCQVGSGGGLMQRHSEDPVFLRIRIPFASLFWVSERPSTFKQMAEDGAGPTPVTAPETKAEALCCGGGVGGGGGRRD